ncbi:PP2C family protein-serine/threonine phosphatase [Nonomuraea sp. NPDC059194]|uniref:PP2C family protein-serine/threonine phosphatase n=1 Tax=Nonomuraea sp. NPDC059194 TaxID=3346764 RepID=UPI0036AB82EB
MNDSTGIEDMLTGLLQASHLTALEQLPSLVSLHAARAGLDPVLIYLADLQQSVMRLLTGHGESAGEHAGPYPAELAIDATLAGRAFQEVRILARAAPDHGTTEWWVPILDGTERLGVLRIGIPEGRKEAQEAMRPLASLVALLVVSHRAHSDSFSRLVRSRPMNVAAEMQWRLMPPLTFATHRVTVSAVMEPAYEVGGDAFDYAIAGDTLHLAVFDAMGHDVSAGLTANLAMAACRNHRRHDLPPTANTEAIERVLIEEFGRSTRFVTAIIADLNLITGALRWVNRGHHPPIIIRGGRWAVTLDCPPAHPMGLDLGLPIVVCRGQLEPGDRLLLYTDGIIEAGAREGREFGMERFVDFIIRHNSADLPVPETLRRLIKSILTYRDGRLDDDATVLLAEWYGPADRRLNL